MLEFGEALAFFITLSISRRRPEGKLGCLPEIRGIWGLLSMRSFDGPAFLALSRDLLLLLEDILLSGLG